MDKPIIRLDKAAKYLELAKSISTIFSKDPSTKVGALFLIPDTYQVLSIGYNGMPRNINEKKEERWERPIKYKYVEHAERNAIYNAAYAGTSLKGSVAVVTLFPCADCSRALIQSGIKAVVTEEPRWAEMERWKADWEISMELFNEAGIEIIYVNPTKVQ